MGWWLILRHCAESSNHLWPSTPHWGQRNPFSCQDGTLLHACLSLQECFWKKSKPVLHRCLWMCLKWWFTVAHSRCDPGRHHHQHVISTFEFCRVTLGLAFLWRWFISTHRKCGEKSQNLLAVSRGHAMGRNLRLVYKWRSYSRLETRDRPAQTYSPETPEHPRHDH